MTIAMVTGASSGIGEEFCRSLDSRSFDSIWLIARRADRLEDIASGLSTPCRVIPADLTSEGDLSRLTSILTEEEPEIGLLVNCAGFGTFGRSWEIPIGETRSMMDLNMGALVTITHACIPYMVPGSTVVQLCSQSAYIPLSDLNVYASTKAFVRHYCDGLRAELRDLGINVLEVSPGWVRTDFIDICTGDNAVPAKVFSHTVTRERVVSVAMRDLDRRRRRSVPDLHIRVQIFLATHFRGLAEHVWKGYFR